MICSLPNELTIGCIKKRLISGLFKTFVRLRLRFLRQLISTPWRGRKTAKSACIIVQRITFGNDVVKTFDGREGSVKKKKSFRRLLSTFEEKWTTKSLSDRVSLSSPSKRKINVNCGYNRAVSDMATAMRTTSLQTMHHCMLITTILDNTVDYYLSLMSINNLY